MIYFIRNQKTGSIKIGFAKSPKSRLKDLQTGSEARLVLLKTIEGDEKKEKELHKRFGHLCSGGEWFTPDRELLDFIAGTGTNPLIGKFFHSFDGKSIMWQGQIVAEIGAGFYLVQLFEWMLGQPSCQKVLNLQTMVGWSIYDTVEEMRDAYDRSPKA